MTVGGIHLQYGMELFYVSFRYLVHCMIDDIVDATEMIDCLHNVIHRGDLGSDAKGVGLEDIASQKLDQPTALYMIGVICQVNLRAMIDASF